MNLPICILPALSLPLCAMTDIPRLLCGCTEHTRWNAEFDYDDLDPVERTYLEIREDAPTFVSLVVRHQVRALPEYRAEPWTEARNVPLVTTGSTCDVCGQRPAGDAFVCPECLDDLRVHLGDVPGLLDDLDVMGARQSRVTSRTRESKRSEHTRWDDLLRPDESGVAPGRLLAARGYNKPLIVERAIRARDDIGNEVTTAVRAITESRGIPTPSLTVRAASRWLMVNLKSVSLDPAAPDVCNGLRKVCKLAKETIDNVEEGVYIGLCNDEQCRAKMYADPEHAEHRCTTCGAIYDVAARREAIRERVLDRLLTSDEIVGLSEADRRTFGSRVTPGQIEHWVKTGRLPRVGTTGDHPSYRAGDVADLVTSLIESQHDVVSLAQAADLLGIPVKTLYRWDSAGLLKSTNPERRRGKTFDLASVRVIAQAQARA